MPRRTFLRSGALGIGAGVTVGLPFLEAMVDETNPAQAQAANPCRFISWFFGSGFNIDKFEPRTASGSPINPADPQTPQLAPFGGTNGLQNYVTICSGLALPPGTIADNHHIGRCGRFGAYPNTGSGVRSNWGGPTIDQVIADHIEANSPTPLHSLQLGVSKPQDTAAADAGTTATSLSMRSLNGSLQPFPAERNPKIAFDSLFSGQNVPPHRLSILDFISTDLSRLQTKLGQADKGRVEAHLEAIRQLESSIDASGACATPTAPVEDNSLNYDEERIYEVNAEMASLVALAFECDLTRVVSFEFSRIAGDSEFMQAGGWQVGRRQHTESHSLDRTYYDIGVVFAMENLARLLDRLRGTDRNGNTVGTSDLLSSSIVYATSDVGWGLTHTQQRVPIILGGRGVKSNGTPYLRSGQHYQVPGSELTLPTHVRMHPSQTNSSDVPTAGNSSDVQLTCVRAFDPAASSGNTTYGGGTLAVTGSGIAALLEP